MSQTLGWIATIMLTTYAIPQIVKIFKRKSVDDISIWMWWLFLIGHLFALAYALMINEPPLIFKYITSIIISIVIIIFYYEYNNTN